MEMAREANTFGDFGPKTGSDRFCVFFARSVRNLNYVTAWSPYCSFFAPRIMSQAGPDSKSPWRVFLDANEAHVVFMATN